MTLLFSNNVLIVKSTWVWRQLSIRNMELLRLLVKWIRFAKMHHVWVNLMRKMRNEYIAICNYISVISEFEFSYLNVNSCLDLAIIQATDLRYMLSTSNYVTPPFECAKRWWYPFWSGSGWYFPLMNWDSSHVVELGGSTLITWIDCYSKLNKYRRCRCLRYAVPTNFWTSCFFTAFDKPLSLKTLH